MPSNPVKNAETVLDELGQLSQLGLDEPATEPKSQSMPLPSEAQLRTRATMELELLYAIEQQVATAHHLSELISRVLELLCAHQGFEAAALLLVDTTEAHVLSVADGKVRGTRPLRRGSALRWLEHSRGPGVREIQPDPPSPEDGTSTESHTQPKVRRAQGMLLSLQGTHKRKVYEVPLSGGGAHMGLLQLIGPQQQSEPDSQVLRRVSLVAAQLGRAILLRHEHEQLMRSERMSLLGQALGAMLHDLRTPLSAVGSSVEIMATAEAPELRREHAERAGRGLEQVERMVQDVLSFARGQREIVPDRFPLSRFVEETRELLEPELLRLGATLEVQGDFEGTARFDAGKIKRVLWNLARNAGQAGAKKFTWKLEREGEYLVFECADTGPGIPHEMNGRLFEAFASFGKPRGTGLGLSMAKTIVDAHCGRIHVKSGVGRGTVFRIELPS